MAVSETAIGFILKSTVFLSGQRNFSEGIHEVTFNRKSLSTGIYFLQLKINKGVMMKKVIIE